MVTWIFFISTVFLWLTILQFPRLPELLALEELKIDLVLVCFDKITLVRTLHLSAVCYKLILPTLLLLITAGSSDYLSVWAKRDKNVFV